MFQGEQVVRKKFGSADRCKKTGKIKYVTADDAITALGKWKRRDPNVCWDLKRIRIYRCSHCKHFHLGKYSG